MQSSSGGHWTELEGQLYTGALSDPLRYEELLAAVRDLAKSLSHISELWELAAAWSEALRTGLSPFSREGPLYTDAKMLGAAFSLRAREIQQLEANTSISRRLENARASQSTWVTLDEAGDLDAGIRSPFRKTEMHLASGWTIVSMVQPDQMHGVPVLVISMVKVDTATGKMEATPGLDDWTEYNSRDEYLASRQAMRTKIEAMAGQPESN